ncbi:HAD-IA family hydrolase [Fervidibacillus halotolerans]|uniref:HAD-IA family hydrolase n=1 Tax=Fervidibacillus halotolerans TaxID=2980027 RepID=A0A9E8RXN7_9BACI|nr:HAD-IA family hydrolase [Fervidibacillus halotolerans]WAA11971.1 HAD-IA family hydrolase [Fervidibacillus halotolerans]
MEKLKTLTVLWDFDGTLFNTYPMYTEIFQKFISENLSDEEVLKVLKVSYFHAVNVFGLSTDTVEKMRQMEKEWPASKIQPFPSVEKVLKSVGKNVIMTHKIRREAERIIDYHGWTNYFSAIVTGDDGFPRKPNPASYEYLHRKHHVDLVIGDRLLDILPGQAIGAKTCLFQNREEGADFYIDHYDEFFEKVAKKMVE